MTSAQQRHWNGENGNKYHERNAPTILQLEGRKWLWREIESRIPMKDLPRSVLEVGAGTGQNLWAIDQVFGHRATRSAIEPNPDALKQLRMTDKMIDARPGTVQQIPFSDSRFDLVFTSGVLIHIPPAELKDACAEIVRVSSKYVVAIEYFAADPEEKAYRGKAGLLWKRDFGKFYLENFPSLVPLGVGFAWKECTGLDNLTWWLFRK